MTAKLPTGNLTLNDINKCLRDLINDVAGVSANAGADVVGPASATDGHVALFNGTTGKLIKDSGVTLSGSNSGDQSLAALVVGPASATDGHLAVFDGTTGKLVKDGGAIPVGGATLAQINTAVTIGTRDTTLGTNALSASSSGADNTGIGDSSLKNNDTGSNNTALGSSSLKSNTGGNYNTGVGEYAGYTNTSGSDNTFVGTSSDTSSATGTNRTAIGYQATVTTDNTVQIGNASITSVTFGNGTAVLHADGSALSNLPVQHPNENFIVAVSDETTALTTGTAKVTFRMPYAFTLTGVKASTTTASTGGTLLAVDVNQNGASVLSTVLTFDASATTTVGAATPAVITTSALTADSVITIDIDAVGSTIAGAGLKVTLLGHQ